jgi:hypothetical protein
MSLQETACSRPHNPSVRKKGEADPKRVSVWSEVDVVDQDQEGGGCGIRVLFVCPLHRAVW